MTKPVEFSKFYRVLNAAKDGEEGKAEELETMLEIFRKSEESDGPLHQLGETFLGIGIIELYKYAETDSIQEIGLIEKEEWEELSTKNDADLPPHLANSMIRFARKNNLSKKISSKWNISKREIDRNVMQMARYITEGIIDALE